MASETRPDKSAVLTVLERDVAVFVADGDVPPAQAVGTVVAASDFVAPEDAPAVARVLRARVVDTDG
jgi:hypothetical protein